MNYYLFATYLFVLIIILVIVCKYFFADVKRQRRMLDEKEKQLLDTFRTLEDAMDDYYAIVEDAREELEKKSRELENRLLLPESQEKRAEDALKYEMALKKAAAENPTKAEEPKSEQSDESRSGFEQMFSDAAANITAKSELHGKIVEMSGQGRPRAEIAKALRITQTEVDLVTGMNRKP